MKNTNIIAMAGDGLRFVKAGYKIIKPLVTFKKKPLIFYSNKSLPNATQTIFVCRQHHFKIFKINNLFKKFFKNFKFVILKRKNFGQAVSCNEAIKKVQNNTYITFGSCDYSYSFNKKKYYNLVKNFDLVVFVTKPNNSMLKNFKQYGWLKKGKKNKVLDIKCKKTVSKNPKKDYVIIGSFTFKNKKIFKRSYNQMIKQKHKINNEYYMDIVAQKTILLKYNVGLIKVSNYKNFGTPQTLSTYE